MPDDAGFQRVQPISDLREEMAKRLIVALDVPNVDRAEELVEQLSGTVSFFKVGLWLQYEKGVDRLLTRIIDSGNRLFLDAKMFDVPNTVAQAVKSAVIRHASFVTVHGDENIMRAAVKAKGDSDLKIFAITVLTSLDNAALYDMGYRLKAKSLVLLRTRKAVECGCDGVIASANDDPDRIRTLAGNTDLLIATPGIRPEGSPLGNQKRVATPKEAIENGADYLVVGSPIVGQKDPRAAAERIIDQMMEARPRRQRTARCQ
ncbi:MAG: orotidine-5'-phosphate decarboxylase [Patescibacteria group bacterium]|nr:orotidine-5'-phosphate decarboxylase [Patescibacteria group bacterium]